ncbi:hypothetical protein B0H16DRAFT_48214 [Mycena metata]|uniref:Uncharacterized protein n=1 Tax=Mycena metata TaxID=1033252 RepID=A0AAD7K067_9AGAR|nr:hypothetical protein B0H16DRAFT_48214 [Mycena metata]
MEYKSRPPAIPTIIPLLHLDLVSLPSSSLSLFSHSLAMTPFIFIMLLAIVSEAIAAPLQRQDASGISGCDVNATTQLSDAIAGAQTKLSSLNFLSGLQVQNGIVDQRAFFTAQLSLLDAKDPVSKIFAINTIPNPDSPAPANSTQVILSALQDTNSTVATISTNKFASSSANDTVSLADATQLLATAISLASNLSCTTV